MSEFYQDNWCSIFQGDAIEELKTIPGNSIHCCVTSPPYYGLRDYGTAKWEGGDDGCDHKHYLGGHGEKSNLQTGSIGSQTYQYKNICGKCGAIRIDDQIGLEKTPEEYVEKMVDVFREVRRVLRDDGTLWLNLGDSYWNNFGGGSNTMTTGNAEAIKTMGRKNKPYHIAYKQKDIMGIPWMVAKALQEPMYKCYWCGKIKRLSQWARWNNGSFLICGSCGKRCGNRQPEKVSDGWYLRQDIIWHKPNPMPESVTDRCTKAHEYIFLLAKSQKYYYDADAIRENYVDAQKNGTASLICGFRTGEHGSKKANKTRSDFYKNEGRNKRSVWTVTTKPFEEAHFATFPPDLIEPCIKAGTSKKGCCPVCSAPLKRGGDKKSEWNSDCGHDISSPVPCTVLDPFGGSGTTGLVSKALRRKSILIELNPKYCEMIKDRVNSVIPGDNIFYRSRKVDQGLF